jgi:hypothetical protein
VDAFWTEEQTTLRNRTREYFRLEGEAFRKDASTLSMSILRHLGISRDGDGFPAFSGMSEGVLIIDEASFSRPRLGLDLMERWLAGAAGSSPEERLFRLARIAGTSAHVFEAGVRGARDKGVFESSLMGCRELQETLAGLASGVELLRLGACRICHLLDRGERDRGEAELAPLYERALALGREAGSVALGLFGEAWTRDNLPGDEFSSEHERNLP